MLPDPTLSRRRWLAGALALPWALSGCSQAAAMALPDVSFTELDGTVRRTADLRGKVLLVNFWATSCVTCVKEMPMLVDTHRQFQAQGLDLLAVAMSYDPPAYVMNFASSRQLPFRVAMDHDGGIARAFGDVQLTPTAFLFDRQGRLAKRYVGLVDENAFHADIVKLLKAAA